jgi:hypothetical protein
VLDLASLRVLFDRLGEAERGEPAIGVAARAEASLEAGGADVAAAAGVAPGSGEGDAAQRAEAAAGLRYLVALLLLRKRVLKMVDAVTPEQQAADLVVVDPKVEGMEPVALYAPELDAERLANLQQELLAALE